MKILKRPIVKDVITNIVYAMLVIVYFICLNTQVSTLNIAMQARYIQISSILFLGIAIVFMEIGYKKDKTKIFVNGLEFIVLAIFTLLLLHVTKVSDYTMASYTQTGTLAFVAYYILKSGIMYTKFWHDKLKSLSDIKEIVKEEPKKKKTKRKNIKEEGK